MDPLTDARREALRQFVAQEGGHAAVVAKFKLTSSNASYLSQIISKDSTKPFGETSARRWQVRLRMQADHLLHPDKYEAAAPGALPITLEETIQRMAEFMAAVPVDQREVIAAVMSGWARRPNSPELANALIALLDNRQ
jgi:hypothetical protein